MSSIHIIDLSTAEALATCICIALVYVLLIHHTKSTSRIQNQSSKAYVEPQALQPPCVKILADAERHNRRNGHENMGFLSFRAGFLPLMPPLLKFPLSHRRWDDLIALMPDLIRDQSLQAYVERLPILPADHRNLPDHCLHRAASFLCIAAHAYIRLDGNAPLELVGASGETVLYDIPASLERPWREVSARLGRETPFMSYIDLIVYNWKWKPDWKMTTNTEWGELRLENVDLLIPTVDNQEENVFYLAQTELLAQATPLMRDIIAAQRAVLQNDRIALKDALRRMISALSHIGRTTLAKVSPRPGSISYTDPVIWTKTVASLAIPLRRNVQGPTGTGSPFFHMMDEFIERKQYLGHLGEESLKLRSAYPPHWRAFIVALGAVSVGNFVKSTDDLECHKLWKDFQEKYRGQFGILGLHRRKVFAYLSVAFRVGRTTTIGGFKGRHTEEPWVKVHQELERARKERSGKVSSEDLEEERVINDLPDVRISELLSHRCQSARLWFAANEKVYDATTYIQTHPGGDRTILASGGRDVSADLTMVQHFSDPAIASKVARFQVGNLRYCVFEDQKIQDIYNALVGLAFKTVDFQNTWATDTTFLDRKLNRSSPANIITAQKLRYFYRSWRSLGNVYAPSLAFYLGEVIQTCLQASRSSSDSEQLKHITNQLDAIQDVEHFEEPEEPSLTMDVAKELTVTAAIKLDRCRETAIRALNTMEMSEKGREGKPMMPVLVENFCALAITLQRLGAK